MCSAIESQGYFVAGAVEYPSCNLASITAYKGEGENKVQKVLYYQLNQEGRLQEIPEDEFRKMLPEIRLKDIKGNYIN